MNPILAALRHRAPGDTVIEAGDTHIAAHNLLVRIDEVRQVLAVANIRRLGLLAQNSVAWVVTDLACMADNLCLLPMPCFFSDAQLRHSLRTAGIDAILTDDPERTARLLGAAVPVVAQQPLAGLTLLQIAGRHANSLPAGTAKVTFTSGSTGTPKGVCLSADNQLRVAQALAHVLPFQAPRHLCLLPFSTLLENTGGIYYPLIVGGSLCIPLQPGIDTTRSGSPQTLSLLRSINRHRPTSMILLPQMLVGLLAALEAGWTVPAELKFAAVGGAKVAPTLIRRARKLGLPVYEGYGLSEAGSVACLNTPDHDRVGSVGRPLPHANVRVDDGDIHVDGNSFLGYAGDPDSWYPATVETGDLGAFDAAGFLHLQGRSKNVLISAMGRNISPEWVESELLSYPEITQCIVFGDARPYCTALIAAGDQTVTDARLEAIVNEVNDELPDYARIRRWRRLTTPLSVAEGLYTANGRPNRPMIARRYQGDIDSLYREGAQP